VTGESGLLKSVYPKSKPIPCAKVRGKQFKADILKEEDQAQIHDIFSD